MSTPKNKSKILIDNHGRRMDYLRLAVTDRCNLRCRYCMPEEGIRQVPRNNSGVGGDVAAVPDAGTVRDWKRDQLL